MLQELIIGVIFLIALAFLARLTYKNFRAKNACSSGCGKCGAVDFEKIEKQIRSAS